MQPVPLVKIHQLMILASIVMCLAFATWASWKYSRTGSPGQLAMAVLA